MQLNDIVKCNNLGVTRQRAGRAIRYNLFFYPERSRRNKKRISAIIPHAKKTVNNIKQYKKHEVSGMIGLVKAKLHFTKKILR